MDRRLKIEDYIGEVSISLFFSVKYPNYFITFIVK